MLQFRYAFLLSVALVCSAFLLSCSTIQNFKMEIVKVVGPEREKILAAPLKFMNQPPSDLLRPVIESGKISDLRVERIEENLSKEEAKLNGRDTLTSYQAWIHYKPIELTDTRIFKGRVLCIPRTEGMRFDYCQDESWTRLEIDWMPQPIFFVGDLSDDEVKKIYETVDSLQLVSRVDDRPVSSDNINQIIKYAQLDNRINVYVTTSKKDHGDMLTLSRTKDRDGLVSFELSNLNCNAHWLQ